MKRFLLTIIAATLLFAAQAFPVSPEQAQQVAANFYKASISTTSFSPSLAYTATAGQRGNSADCFYIYNIGNGFVIVSADTRVKPVLGYSTEGTFNPNNLPLGLQDLLDSYTDEIQAIMQNVASPTPELQAQWDELTAGTFEPVRGGRSVSALLDDETGINNWQQNNGYNYYCPADASGPAGHCYVGCCALSMGQVMHYWKHPAQGTGSHSYECNHSSSLNGLYGDYGTLSANFGSTTYDFANMPNYLTSSTPSSQILKIAKLLYHCGISIDMWYGNQGSMGFHADIGEALETYFKYDETFTVWKDSYHGNWDSLLKSDLDLGRPMIYCAYASVGGHEFVCDGYNDNNYFHFNMGWGGSYNGYYAIDNLNAQYNFNSSHGVIAHIRPLEDTPGVGVTENEEVAVSIYPNPVVSQLNIIGENIASVNVYDMMGQLVIQAENPANNVTLSTSALRSGTYFVRVVANGDVVVKKIVKK